MSEVSLELNKSAEQSDEVPKRKRPKSFSSRPEKAKSPEKENKNAKTKLKIGSPLLCESWQIPNKRRFQIGFVGLTFLLPFVTLSLLRPDWTGHIGSRLSLGLFSFIGQAAFLVPLALLYVILSCTGFRTLKKTKALYIVPLFLCLILLTQRASDAGGWLGQLLDGLLLAALGPGGAWLSTGTLLTLTTLAFLPGVRRELQQSVSFFKEHCRDLLLRLKGIGRSFKSVFAKKQPEKLIDDIRRRRQTSEQPEKTATTQHSGKFLFQDTGKPAKCFKKPLPMPEHHGVLIRNLRPPESEENINNSLEPSVDVKMQAPDLFRKRPTNRELHQEEVNSPETEKTLIDPNSIPATPPPPSLKETAPVQRNESDNIIRFADSAEIEESLELEKKKLTKSDEAQAAVPRARHFELPPLVLLDEIPHAARAVPTEDKSQALLEALDAFGVKAKLLQIVRGPAVTRYELQPARGVKVSKFTSLTKDIALALASTAVRIEAPIPGKSAIGIEIPNKHTDLVVLKDIIRDTTFTDSKGLTVALGKDLSGRPVVTDLQKMPHLLVAGTTGSGKSVCVNGLIISLLYRFTPDQLQLMMVDPKQVELSVYEDIPHLVGFSDSDKGEIIVDPKKAAQALHQVVGLMEERYKLFAENKVRNLAEYNQKFDEEPLPWFVVIIDELADLMMVASKSVETSICRIAQKARAAGIHLVLATQRPSADVLTGLIKVNIPSRAAFAVSSQVDSRVILDTGGAEHLLGKGDMLFQPVDASDPRRIQGSYVGNDEISRVVEFWKGQGLPENRIEFEIQDDILAEDNADEDTNSDDALIQEALKVTLQRKQASASMLQTELKVGYARARRLLIAMEKKGWVGPPEGSKPRKILYSGPYPSDDSTDS